MDTDKISQTFSIEKTSHESVLMKLTEPMRARAEIYPSGRVDLQVHNVDQNLGQNQVQQIANMFIKKLKEQNLAPEEQTCQINSNF